MWLILGGCRTPDLVRGPLHSTSAEVKILLYINIGYYTGSRSVRLGIFTSLTYFVESAARDKIQRRVKISSRTERLPV